MPEKYENMCLGTLCADLATARLSGSGASGQQSISCIARTVHHDLISFAADNCRLANPEVFYLRTYLQAPSCLICQLCKSI